MFAPSPAFEIVPTALVHALVVTLKVKRKSIDMLQLNVTELACK